MKSCVAFQDRQNLHIKWSWKRREEPQVCSWKHQHLFSHWDYSSCLHTRYMSNVISSLRPFLWHGKGLEKTIWEAWQSVICWETRDQRCNPAPVQRQQMLVRMKKKNNFELYPWAALRSICCKLKFDCHMSRRVGSRPVITVTSSKPFKA